MNDSNQQITAFQGHNDIGCCSFLVTLEDLLILRVWLMIKGWNTMWISVLLEQYC